MGSTAWRPTRPASLSRRRCRAGIDDAPGSHPATTTAASSTAASTPPLVTVQSVQITTVKIGHKKVKEIVVDFSGPVSASLRNRW